MRGLFRVNDNDKNDYNYNNKIIDNDGSNNSDHDSNIKTTNKTKQKF